jgi:hypothetical protein
MEKLPSVDSIGLSLFHIMGSVRGSDRLCVHARSRRLLFVAMVILVPIFDAYLWVVQVSCGCLRGPTTVLWS